MKKWLVSILSGILAITISTGVALAETIPDSTRQAMDQVKEKREDIRQLRAEKREKLENLRGILESLRANAGIVPLTEEEKNILKEVRNKVLPLVEQLRSLKNELKEAISASDSEKVEVLKQQILDVKELIKSQWEPIAELKEKVKANREKAKTFITDDIRAAMKQRKELWQQVKIIREDIKALVNEIRLAKTEQDFETIDEKSQLLFEKLVQVEENIKNRMEIIDGLIAQIAN